MKRPQFVKELGTFLTMKVLENTLAVLSLGKLCDEHGYSYEWINGQKPHLNKNGIRIRWNTENFVPIVVPGLSLSSSSSSSTSPPMTPSTVSSESVDSQVRGDPYSGPDHHPAIVSSESVIDKYGETRILLKTSEGLLNKPTKIPKPNRNENHEQAREDPCHSDIPEWLQEFRESCG